jgi:hypothetical protein
MYWHFKEIAFEYHLQYELSISPLFVILPNLREKMQSLLIHDAKGVQFATDDLIFLLISKQITSL